MATNINVNDILLDNQVAFVTSDIPLASNISSFSLNTSSYKIAPSDSAGKRYISKQSNIFNGHWGNTPFDSKLQQDGVNFPFVTKNSVSLPRISTARDSTLVGSTGERIYFTRGAPSVTASDVMFIPESDGIHYLSYCTNQSSSGVLPDSAGRNVIFMDLIGSGGGGGGGYGVAHINNYTTYGGAGGGGGALLHTAIDFSECDSVSVQLGDGGARGASGWNGTTKSGGDGDGSSLSVNISNRSYVFNVSGGKGGGTGPTPAMGSGGYTSGGQGGKVTVPSGAADLNAITYYYINGADGGAGARDDGTDFNSGVTGGSGNTSVFFYSKFEVLSNNFTYTPTRIMGRPAPSAGGHNNARQGAGGGGGGASFLTTYGVGGSGGGCTMGFDIIAGIYVNTWINTTAAQDGGNSILLVYY